MSTSATVIGGEGDVTPAWLGRVLAQPVVDVRITHGFGNWSRQLALDVALADGSRRALRLKLCPGETFGRSEVDYYLRDYADLADAPLVRCLDARFEAGVGYHVLLEDLSGTHEDRRDVSPTLAYGLAVATALARMHRHHWESEAAPDPARLDRYFDEIRPGVAPIEQATGSALRARFDEHEREMRARWSRPRAMTLLHGDLNPTNILTPRGADAPVLFLDRQPFDWSLTYGVAAWDLAYFMIPWWSPEDRAANEMAVLRRWHEVLARPDYGWDEAIEDWRLSVEQCLHVPIEWCSKVETFERMRSLWERQFARTRAAIG